MFRLLGVLFCGEEVASGPRYAQPSHRSMPSASPLPATLVSGRTSKGSMSK